LGEQKTYDDAQVNLNDIRRCALFHYDGEKNAIEFRHYLISAQPVGISRAVKKIIHARIPDLSKVDDIADFVQRYLHYICSN
jgi:ribosome biogenesis protein SSF1/2